MKFQFYLLDPISQYFCDRYLHESLLNVFQSVVVATNTDCDKLYKKKRSEQSNDPGEGVDL